MIYFVVPRVQDFGIRDYLQTWGRRSADLLSIIHYEELIKLRVFPAGTYIFSALDQLTPGGLILVRELQKQLKSSPNVGRVLNDPDRVLLRFELLERLNNHGLNRHRAFRATGNLREVRFPAFLHEEFRHTGALSPLLFDQAELKRAIGRAVLLGSRPKELLVVEFCDTVDEKGLFRKYTAYVVGSQIIARTMGRGRKWMLKAEGVEFSEEMLLEERSYVFANPYEDQLRPIFSLAGIEYGRIDFSIKDGKVQTWEINTNPSVGPSPQRIMPEEYEPVRQPIRDHFSRRFHAALLEVDSQGPRDPVHVAFSPECILEASPMVRPVRQSGILARVARRLHLNKALVDGAVRILSPLVTRGASRFK